MLVQDAEAYSRGVFRSPRPSIDRFPGLIFMSRVHIQLEVRAVGPASDDGSIEQQWFAVRCADGAVHPVRMRWEDGWKADLEQLYHHDGAGEVLNQLGLRLMRLLSSTGWPRQAARRPPP